MKHYPIILYKNSNGTLIKCSENSYILLDRFEVFVSHLTSSDVVGKKCSEVINNNIQKQTVKSGTKLC